MRHRRGLVVITRGGHTSVVEVPETEDDEVPLPLSPLDSPGDWIEGGVGVSRRGPEGRGVPGLWTPIHTGGHTLD